MIKVLFILFFSTVVFAANALSYAMVPITSRAQLKEIVMYTHEKKSGAMRCFVSAVDAQYYCVLKWRGEAPDILKRFAADNEISLNVRRHSQILSDLESHNPDPDPI